MDSSGLITYRKYKDELIPLLTIKKGTVLFRTVLEKEKFVGDYLGIKLDEQKYCLSNNYNVFFFMCPYVFDGNKFHAQEAEGKNPELALYVVLEDLKVVLMVKPSDLIRPNKDTDNSVSTNCENFTFCNGLKGRHYDPCFYEEFMKENLDIVGSLAIQYKDAQPFVKKLKTKSYDPFRKYISLVKDKKYFGAPELILYPRKVRSMKEIGIDLDKIDFQQYIDSEDFNYYPIAIYPHKPMDSSDKLYGDLKKFLSPEGLNIDDQKLHITFDKRTYFYTIYESIEDDDLKFVLPLKEKNKLSILQKPNKQFIFSYAKLK